MALRSIQLMNDQYENRRKRQERLEHLGRIISTSQISGIDDFRNIILGSEEGVKSFAVAGFDRQGIATVLDRSTKIIGSVSQGFKKDQFKIKRFQGNNDILMKSYRSLINTGFFDTLLSKEEKEQIIESDNITEYENLDGYAIHQSNNQARKAIENIRSHSGSFVSFDLESLGGKNIGIDTYPAQITEVSFIRHDAKSKSDEAFTTIIGIDETEEQRYRQLLEKWKIGAKTFKNGKFVTVEGISNQELVTLHRLAKMGSRTTKIDRSDPVAYRNGVVKFLTFAGKEDTPILNEYDIERGIDLLREVGILQENSLNTHFEYNINQHQRATSEVKPWEAEVLKGLQGVYEEGLTLVGQNSRTFDLPFINRLINSDKISEGMREVLNAWTGNKKYPYMDIANHLDMLPLLRQFLNNDFYSNKDLEYLEKLGLSRNTLEAVTRRLTAEIEEGEDEEEAFRNLLRSEYEKGGAGSAHMAETDVRATINTVNKLLFEDTDDQILLDFRKKIEEAGEVSKNGSSKTLGVGSVLFAKNAFDAKQYNLIQFAANTLNKDQDGKSQLNFMDGINIEPNGEITITDFKQFGIQKHGLYEISAIKKFEIGNLAQDKRDKISEALHRTYPNMDISQMMMVEFNPIVRDSDQHIRAQTPLYYIGSAEEIKHALLDNAYYVGEKQSDDGSIDASNMTDFVKKQLTKVIETEEVTPESPDFDKELERFIRSTKEFQLANAAKGDVTEQDILDSFKSDKNILQRFQNIYKQSIQINQKNISQTIISPIDENGKLTNEFIEASSKKVKEDAAARLNREHDLKKDKAIMQYLDIRDKILSGEITEEELGKKGYTQKEISEISRIKNDTKITDKEKKDSILSIFWEKSLGQNPINSESPYSEYSLRHIFGYTWHDPEKKDQIYAGTLSNQTARISSLEKDRDIIKAAIEIAEKKAGDNHDAAAYYYKSIMSTLDHKAQLNAGDSQPKVLGWKNTGSFSYEYDNKFDIDLTGFHNLRPGTIATINLKSAPERIIETIFRAGREKLYNISDYTSADQSMLLRELQSFLNSEKGGFQIQNLLPENTITKTDTLMVSSQKMMNTLQGIRQTKPTAGHLKGTFTHTLDVGENGAYSEFTTEDLENIARDLQEYIGTFTGDTKHDQELVKKMTSRVMDEVIMPRSEDVVLNHDDELKRLTDTGYYNKKEAEILEFIRERHREGAKKYVTAIFDMVGKMGGQIGWNTDSRQIFATFGDRAFSLELPMEQIIDGQFQWKLGNTLASQPIGFYEDNTYSDNRKLVFDSKIGAIVGQNKNLIEWHTIQAQTGYGLPEEHLSKVMGDINEVLRTSPAVEYSLRATRANQFRIDFEDVYTHVHELIQPKDLSPDNGTIKTDRAFVEVLLDLIQGKAAYNPEHPEYSHFLALNANVQFLLQRATEVARMNESVRKTVKDTILNEIDINVKPIKHGALGFIGTNVNDIYNYFNATKRDPGNIEDVSKIDVTEIIARQEAYLDNPDKNPNYRALRDIDFGKVLSLQSVYSSSTYDSIAGRHLETHFRGRAIHIDPKSLTAIRDSTIDTTIEELKNDKAAISAESIDLITSMTPEEGTAFIHGQVFDELFSTRSSVQKINIDKIVDIDYNELLDIENKQVLNAMYDDETGFHYAKGKYITTGETIAHIPGFGARPLSQPAKYDGLLKFGFFDRTTNSLVNEDIITDIIKHDLKFQEMQAATDTERLQRIFALLQQRFLAGYYIQSVEANSMFKLNEFSEKGMTRALIQHTGGVDKNVRQVMSKLGFYDYRGKDKVLNRLGTLEGALIKTISSENLSGDFWDIARGRYKAVHDEELTDDKINSILKEANFQNTTELQNAIYAERYGPTRLAEQLFVDSGIISKGMSWDLVSNFTEASMKHGDISSVRRLLDETFFRTKNTVLQEGKSIVEARQIAGEKTKQMFMKYFLGTEKGFVNKDVANELIQVLDDGRLIIKNDQLPWLQQLSDERYKVYGLQMLSDETKNEWLKDIGITDENGQRTDITRIRYKRNTDSEGRFTGKLIRVSDPDSPYDFEARAQIGSVEFSKNTKYWENSKDAPDAVRLNQRAITNLGNIRVGDRIKGHVKEFLDARASRYGDTGSMEVLGKKISADQIYEELIEPMKSGEVVQSAAIDQITKHMFNRAGGGERLTGWFDTNEGKVEWKFNTKAIKNFVKQHNVGNGDFSKGMNIVLSLLSNAKQKTGITTVNEAGATNLLNVFNAATAVGINSGKVSIEDAQRLGFELIGLDDLITGRRGTQFFDNSLYSKNWIVDISKSKLGEQLLQGLGKNEKYIAISGNPMINDSAEYIEDLANQPQEKLKGFIDSIREYSKDMNNVGISSEKREEKLEKILQAPEAIRRAQFDMWYSKKGVTAEFTRAHMSDASRNTSRGINLMGTEKHQGVAIHNLGELDQLARARGANISNLSIFGINLVEEAQKEGGSIQLSYSILSKERMHQVYDRNFDEISKALSGNDEALDILEQIKQATLGIVQTEGVSGISGREPVQYPSSISQRQIFFSDIAQGNEVISELANAQLRKEDFDADAVINALHKEEAAITINGKEIRASLDSAMLTAINRMSQQNPSLGLSVRLLDTGAEDRFANYAQSQIYIGAGEAQRFRYISDFSQKLKETDDFDTSFLLEKQKQYVSKLTGMEIDGLDYAHTLFKTASTPGERNVAQEYLADTLRKVYRDAIAGAIVDKATYGEDFAIATGETQRTRLWEQLGDGAENTLLGRAIAFSIQDEILSQDLVTRAGFLPTGRVNRYIQSVYDISQAVFNSQDLVEQLKNIGVPNLEDPGILSEQINMVGLMVQEGFMSPKHTGSNAGGITLESLQAEFVPRLEKAMTRAFSLGDNATESERESLKAELFDVIYGIYENRKSGREMIRNPTLPTLLEYMRDNGEYGTDYSKYVKEDENTLTREGIQAIHNFTDFLVDTVGYNGGSRSMFNIGSVNPNSRDYHLNISLPRGTNYMPARVNLEIVNSTARDLGVVKGVVNEGDALGIREPGKKEKEIEAIREEISRKYKPEQIHDAISTVAKQNAEELIPRQQVAKMTHGHGLMGAAIGVAGGLLISGFAGNPSERRPRQYPPQQVWGNAPIPDSALPPAPIDQAADASWMYGQQYPMTLSDSGMSMNSNPPIVGYNINISGMSPKGESAAKRAIGSAINYGVPQNSSVNVAVHNNYQDTMSQYQVNRMVQTSLGF